MSKCTELLSSLQRRGVQLWLDDAEQLRYRCAKGMLDATDIAALGELKHEIVVVLRQRCAPGSNAESAQGRRAAAVIAPLTRQQTWMWESIQRGNLSYLNVFVFRLCGPLQPLLLQQSYETLVRRHDSLRMRIVVSDGVPRQCVDDPAPKHYAVPVDDLSALAEEDAQSQVQDMIRAAAHEGCDLSLGPLSTARLLRLSDTEHLLLSSAHHIISDAFALALIFRELWLLYCAAAQGKSSPLRISPMQYADYAIWQEQARRSPAYAGTDDYWAQRLRGGVGIQWPLDVTATGASKLDMYEHPRVAWGSSLTAQLREIAARAGTTVAMVALTAYVAALSRWCKQRDLVIAVTITGRDRPELESMAGYCAYALYMRFQLSDAETFESLLAQSREQFYEALSHADFGCAVARHPHLHAHALFQWVSWPLEEPGQLLAQLGIKAEWLPVNLRLSKDDPFCQYDIMPALWEVDDEIVGMVHCRRQVLHTVRGFARRLLLTAQELADNPRGPVAISGAGSRPASCAS